MREEDEMLKRYLKDITNYPLVTPEREKELANIIHDKKATKEDKRKAKEELVLGNLRLVVTVALKVNNRIQRFDDMNLSTMDLIQVGNIALMRAADLFLAERNNKFCTYAYITVERRMMKAVQESRFVRVPCCHFKRVHDMDVATEKYGDMDNKDMAKKLNVLEDTVRVDKMNRNSRTQVEDMNELLERFDSEEKLVTDVLQDDETRSYIFEKIKELSPRYREVLFYHFFGNTNMTLDEIGKRIGVTRERVRQILMYSVRAIKAKITEEEAYKRVGGKHKKGGKNEKNDKKR